MKIFRYFFQAIDALWINKLRTALSTLWIVIWIASVTIMLALWEWLKAQMLENLSVSNDVISILPKDTNEWAPADPNNPKKPEEKAYIQVKEVFNLETIDKIKKYVWNIKSTIALAQTNWWNIKFAWKDLYSSIVWVTIDYLSIKKIKIVS